MAVFEYKGFDAKGAAAVGIVDADSPKGARTKLRRQGVFATDVFEQKGGGGATRGAGLNVSIDFKKYFERVSSQDISTMTQQLSTLVGAGIPMVEALTALIEQTENGKLKLVLTDVREKVNEGIPLARSMKEHPRVFDELYTSMVAAGEQSGALEVVLQRLSEFTDAMVRLKGKVLSAMLYPVLMGTVSICVLLGMFIFVIPRVKRIFDSFGATLPLATRITLGISDFFVNYWYLVILFVVAAAYGFRRWVRTPEGRFKWHRFLLHAPIVGKVNQLVAVSRFCRTLSTLLISGVPILTAMTIVKDVVQNDVLAKAIGDAGTNIAEGQSIARPLKEAEEFPPLVTHMIAIGERTGELETMLGRVADAYDQQTEIRLEALTSLLGPLLIMCLGGLVGLMAVTILVPMLNISSIVR
jgi:general secretion pathway protein F